MSSILRVLVLLIAHLAAPLAIAAAGSEEAASFTGPLAHNLEGAGSKLVALAEAIPADKYSWRPSPEVRSVSEVLMHVVGGNLQLVADLGAGAPDGVVIAAAVRPRLCSAASSSMSGRVNGSHSSRPPAT